MCCFASVHNKCDFIHNISNNFIIAIDYRTWGTGMETLLVYNFENLIQKQKDCKYYSNILRIRITKLAMTVFTLLSQEWLDTMYILVVLKQCHNDNNIGQFNLDLCIAMSTYSLFCTAEIVWCGIPLGFCIFLLSSLFSLGMWGVQWSQ